MNFEKTAHRLATNYADDERLHLEDAILEALYRAYASGAGKFQLWGTDWCPRCEYGRVTLYSLGPGECIPCQNERAEAPPKVVPEKEKGGT